MRIPQIPKIQDANVKNYIVRLHQYDNNGVYKLRLNERKYLIEQYVKYVNSEISKSKFRNAVAFVHLGKERIEIIHFNRENKVKTIIIDQNV